nr:host cell factor-like isoform X2 [Aedes albopictus]
MTAISEAAAGTELVPASTKNNAILRWKRVTNPSGPQPRPRHGHRAVNIKELMVVFGGGNEGIVDELHVYNTATNQWYVPATKGDVPPGCAAYGFVVDGTRILVFGGMVEYGKYSNELYELQATKWEWKKLKPKPPESGLPPCRRLGHSFTLVGDKIYLFGGLANESDDPKNNIPKYLNDLYILEIKNNQLQWEIPTTFGESPPPRESHTAVSWYDKKQKKYWLVIYGGMSGCRLGDLWLLDTDTMSWTRPRTSGPLPLPRSLHSSTLIGNRMYVFGGWVPLVMEDVKAEKHEKEWKCTNTLACLNLETMTWEELDLDTEEDNMPRARAGHCAVGIHTRLYIWSGRDGYRKAWNNQVCCKDLWYLEVERPTAASRVQLVRASTHSLELCWPSVPSAAYYILEVQKIPQPPPTPPAAPAPTPVPSITPTPAAAAAASPAHTPAAIASPSLAAIPQPSPVAAVAAGSMSPAAAQLPAGLTSGEPLLPQPIIKTLPGRAVASPIAVSPSPVAVHPSASPLAGSASPNILQTAAQAISSPVHNPPGMQSPTPIAMAAVPSSPVHSVSSPPVQRIVTKVQAAKPMQQQQPQQKQVLTPSSPILQQQPTQIIQTQVQAQPMVQQQQVTQITQQQPQTIRVVSGTGAISNAQQITTGGAGTPIRVLSSTGQQVRIATQQPVVNVSTATVQQIGQQTATVLRGQNIVTAGGQLQQQRIVTAPAGSTTTTATIGGKQIILQKPLTIVGGAAGGTATGTINNAGGVTVNQPQIVTLVKTSQGMTVQTLPKMNVLQKGTVAGTIQQPQQIVTSNIIGGAGLQQATVGGQKTAVIGGNVVKLMSSTGTIGGKQILMKNPNIVQVGKMATNVAGKPTLVITNKAGQQIRTGNQQVIVVTTPQGIRTVSGTVTSSANNFVSLSTSQMINTISTSRATNIGGATVLQAGTAGTAGTANIGGQAIKLRAVQGGKPITFTVPVGGLQGAGQKIAGTQIINMQQKSLTIGGKAVTVQLAPSVGGQKTVTIVPSSTGTAGTAGGIGTTMTGVHGQQKIVMLPSKTTTRIVTQQQYQQIQLQQQQAQLQQQQQQQQQEQVSTDAAFAALAAEAGLIENDGDQIEQMDGCFDLFHSDDETDSDEEEQLGGAQIMEVDSADSGASECKKMKLWPGVIEQLDGCNDFLSSDDEEDVAMEEAVSRRTAPRYVRLGLFGGAAAIENPEGESTEEQDPLAQAEPPAEGTAATAEEGAEGQPEATAADSMEQDQPMEGADPAAPASEQQAAGDEGVSSAGALDDQQQLLSGGAPAGEDAGEVDSSQPAGGELPLAVEAKGGDDGLNASEATAATAESADVSMQDVALLAGSGVTEAEQSGLAETTDNMSFGDQPDSSATSTQDATKDASLGGTAGSPHDATTKMADSASASMMATSGSPGTVQLLNADGTSTTATTMVVSVNSAPTASETEAANILTTIKSGELLSLQNADLLAAAGPGSDNIIQLNSGLLQSSGTIDGFTRSLSGETQTITFKTTGNGSELTQVATLADGTQLVAQLPTSSMVKSEESSNATAGGHLDALAEAAASATSVLSDLMGSTSSSSAVSSSPSGVLTIAAASPQTQQQQPATATTIKYFDANSKQFMLTSPLLQSPVNPPANILSNSSNGTVPTVVTTIPGTTSAAAGNKLVTTTKTVRGTTAKAKDEKEDSKPRIKDESEKWYTVGIFKTLSHTVSNFVDFDEWNCLYDGDTLTADNLPDLVKYKRLNLEPGCAYRFRVAAINSCGRGEWSDVAPFKTCLPGFPGAPSAIKISKSTDGAHLSWEPPPSTTGDILEYSVYLAVKSQNAKDKANQSAQLAFVRVYCGPNNQCTVPNQSLLTAHVDQTSKPAIIFRIAARNDKGYGPATQVRWLQDPQSAKGTPTPGATGQGSGPSPTAVKRLSDKAPSTNTKRAKTSVNSSMIASPN